MTETLNTTNHLELCVIWRDSYLWQLLYPIRQQKAIMLT